MAMSMRDLLSHSDDEEEILKPEANNLKNIETVRMRDAKNTSANATKIGDVTKSIDTSKTNEVPKATDTTHAVKEPSTLKSMFTKRLSNHFEKDPVKKVVSNEDGSNGDTETIGLVKSSSTNGIAGYFKSEEGSRTGWIKDKMAGPFNRLSLTKTTYSSIDIQSDVSSEPKQMWKAQSELNLKSTGTTQVDGSSRGWLKGHLSSLYQSKSKTSLNDLNTSQELVEASPREENTSVAEQEEGVDVAGKKVLSEKPSITLTGASGSKPKAGTLVTASSSDETHLPLQGLSKVTTSPSKSTHVSTITTASTSTTIKHNKLTRKKNSTGDSPRTLNTNLTLSELLHSQRSPSSPMEEILPDLSMRTSSPIPSARKEEGGAENGAQMTEEELELLAEEIVTEDLKTHFKPNTSFPISFTHLWYMSLLMYTYLQYELPVYVGGCITGMLLMYVIGCSLVWFISSSAESTLEYKKDLKFLLRKENNEKSSIIFKSLPKPETLRKPRTLKVWMSLAYQYDGEFQKDKTRAIYTVVHEGIIHLFLYKPRPQESKTNRSKLKKQLQRETKKAAMERVEKEKALFAFEWQYIIQLHKCLLYLKPDDLPIRRIWGKKYPMKLCVPSDAINKLKINTTLEDLTIRMQDILEGNDKLECEAGESEAKVSEDEELYLFSNTGREKEDLFYRMQLCIRPLKHQVTFSDIKRNMVSKLPRESYPHYMIDLMTESERVMQRNIKGKKVEPHLAWLNIFIGRAFWDFWHESYWIDKLHQKIQTRLSKLNTPPFITSIKLKDMNSGHNVPIIHKGSVPTLDENGVWTDLQITYKGYFTLTLETYLNVDYYIGVLSGIAKQKAGVDPRNHSQLSKLTKLSELADEEDSLDGGMTTPQDQSFMNETMEEEEAAKLHDELHEFYMDDMTDGLDEGIDPFMSDPRTKAFLESNAGKKVVGVVGWLAKSKIAKKVAETGFAKKAYEKAYEKFRKMPIILRVEIQNVKGNLAVNLPPPPSNRLWFGFRGNPVIFITASPKIGEKQVRLTYLTNWIERKLKEEFKKFLVLPSMQDISIKIMDSQLKDLNPERPLS